MTAKLDNTKTKPKAYLIGGGIGSMAAAAFMIRDGGVPGENISVLEAKPLMGGSLDGAGEPAGGYSLRGGRMLTTDNYECTWNLFKTIPSLTNMGKSVFDETIEFNEKHKAHSMARLVDSRRAKVPAARRIAIRANQGSKAKVFGQLNCFHAALREAGNAYGSQVILKTADHDCIKAACRYFDTGDEPFAVKNGQQRRKTVGMAVVRGSGEEKTVFEPAR